MSFSSNYNALRKKRKKEETVKTGNSFTDKYLELKSNRTEKVEEVEEIAPVAKDLEKYEKQEERKWFQKGAFEDGYQFGDVLRTINASSDDLGNNVMAGILGIGEKVIDAGAYAIGLLGKNTIQPHMQKFIEKDLYDEEALAKKLNVAGNPIYNMTTKKLLGIGGEEHSVFGEKADSVAQSGGQLLGTVALQSVGVPWFVTTGVTSFGSEAESALNEGATYGEAGVSGLVTAGAEILTEKLSGGIKFGKMGTLDDGLTKALARGISNKFVRGAAKLGMDIVGEGAEEVLSEGIGRFGQWLTYQDDKTLGDMLTSEEAVDSYVEAFLGGAMLGGVGSATQAVGAKAEGRDATSGLTANEEAVFNKLFEERVAEAKKNGEKISKTEIHNKILDDMEKGRIDTDTIESILGGDAYKAYKESADSVDSLLEEEKALRDEFNTLNKMVKHDMTGEQNDRLEELRTQLTDIKTKIAEAKEGAKGYRSQLNDAMSKSLAKDTYLQESYAEVARRGQAFEADVSKYDEKQRATIQSAIDSGLLNNTRRTHEMVDMVAKLSADKGVLFDFSNSEKIAQTGYAIEGKTVNAFVTKDGDTKKITLNMNSPKYLDSVVGHEITHVLEGSELYGELQKTLFEYAKSKGEFESRRKELEDLYKGVKDADVDAELTADLVGDYLFRDSDFIDHLTANRNVFQKIYDEIKYLCKVVTAGSKEARELEKVKKAFEKAYRESGEAKGGTNYSLTEPFTDSNGKRFDNAVLLDTDVFDNVSPKNWWRVLKDHLEKRVDKSTFIMPVVDENGNTQMLEFAKSNERVSKDGKKQHPVLGDLYMTSDNISKLSAIHIDEIVEVSEEDAPYYTQADGHGWLDSNGWLHRTANVINAKNGNIYQIKMDIAKAEDGRIILYALNGKTKRVGNAQVNSLKIKGSGQNTNSDGIVPQKETNVNRQYSLSAEQEAYFKDSKVRDENGNLKVMYHGTSKGGHTVFDTYGSNYGLFGQGSYFTDSKNIAESYTKKGKGSNPQVYETYLNITNPMDMDGEANPEEWRKAFPDADFPESGTNEDFYRAMEEYFMDEQYPKWEAAEAAMESIMGMGYDGITHIGGGRVNPNGERHQVYIAFNPEQIKNIDNTKPTDSADIRYSLSDSEGKKLTKEQSEYFKDSKMRDDNGNLKVMYHGTPNADFSVFKDGTYFTENKWYADLYQNPNASSISTGKVATNPNTFEVYLDIKKPFDINDAEARSIYINDYIKGGNAVGINPYMSDAEYDKIKTIDWTEGEDLREFLIDNGYDYDGLVLDEGAVGGYGDDVKYRGKSYVIFSPEQVKNVDNKTPTSNPDIRFSLSKPVEETKDLMALHNLKSNELLKSLELGGLPMPSIAIIKAEAGHDQYGEVSLILPKEAIDPQANRDNKVYGGDAWTPTYPRMEYKANKAVEKRIRDKYYALEKEYGHDKLRPLYDYVYELENALNRDGGEAELKENLYIDTRMMQVYLLDSGKGEVPTVKKEIRTELTDHEVNMYEFFTQKLGDEVINGVNQTGLGSPIEQRKAYWENYGESIKEAYGEFLSKEFNFSEEDIQNVLSNMRTADFLNVVRGANRYQTNGRVTIKTENDYDATREAIREAASEGYKAWVDDLFGGSEEKSGIRNNVDYYTRSGNSRSWEALHWENTLENVVKAMKQQDNTGSEAVFGVHKFFAASSKDYKNVAEIKADSNRLHKISDGDYKAAKEAFESRFVDIANRIMDKGERNPFIAQDNAMECIVDAIRHSKTEAGILRELKQYQQLTVTEKDVADIVSLVNDISNMPTGYFEAKPMRAVGFEEVGVFVIPRNADVKLKQELLNRGYSIAEYDPDVEGDRQKVVNSFEEYKFSLSDASEIPTKRSGKYATLGKDMMLEQAPTQDDIAPVQEGVAENATTTEDIAPDGFAPITEEDADKMRSESFQNISDTDAPMETEAPYYESENAAPSDPFENRDIKEVGDRKVKAYMYENPEVKPFFQAEANIMLGELERAVKGERFYTPVEGGVVGEYGTDSYGVWTGTSRSASVDISELLDNGKGNGKGYTYAEIEKGLKAIIEDDGKENNACSKRIEFFLNDRLLKGYQDFDIGYEVPPNQDYINLLNEKQITEYNEEAKKAFFESVEAEDIAPIAENVQKEQYEAIKPKKSKEPKLIRVKEGEDIAPTYETTANGGQRQRTMFADGKTAEIVDTEPTNVKEKGGIWSAFMRNFVDKQHIFEKLSLKTGNRELQAKANFMRSSESRAQHMIGKGVNGVRALTDIRKEVESKGLENDFEKYLYHMHNIDRMTLDVRFGTNNKAVFGDTVTAEVSQNEVKQYEAKHPEFKRWAQDVYAYNKHLRKMLVDGGVISQETADLWAQMYPHYVPIRRQEDFGASVNVPLDTRKTGVNAPVKRAVGGNSNILNMFDTMAMRTEQTFRAIAKNNFGVELKNTLGTQIANQGANVDEIIDSLDKHEELLKEGKNGMSPTFTVFENGERVTFEISEEMYDALKPTNKDLARTIKPLNMANNIRRGLITEYNPVFLATNAIKDAQDILMNSQHAAQTYKNIPKAIKELATKGKWYAEYMENGGEDNTYFDGQSNTFKADDTGIKKIIGIPLRAISAANNFVERAPRLAEYIASREAGASIESAMLDAARVTTNFAAGGDVTKFLNRNGATFLNASVQGAAQQVRNIREAKANGLKGWVQLAAKTAIAGIPALLLNGLLWDDDEDYEELSDYVKDNYYIVAKYGDGQFVRIPKGRTVAVIQDAFEQIGNALTGNDEVDLKNFLDLAISNLAPNNPLENHIFAPIGQAITNKTWYGEDLVPTRLQDLPANEQFDESTDSLSRWLGEVTNTSPIKWNYLLDQYSGGVGDVFLPMMTPEAERGNDTLLGNIIAPYKDKFTTDSTMNNQNVSDFYDTKDDLTVNAKASTATDEDKLMSKYMNSVSSELGELYGLKREIQNSDLPDSRKYEKVRDIQDEINALARESLNAYKNVQIDGEYAVVGDRQYRMNDEGEWTKLTEKQYNKQEEVTDELGISASDYWSNKSEYDFAYENPEKYAVAKSVGGYDFYKGYMSDLYDIKADKDESGKSIRGSRKQKVADYVNSLDIDYGERLILFKGEYKADDTYNMEIIEYLNNRQDISYKEMVDILKELGFKVDSEGNVSWD